jgi:hypothetical protein
MTASFTRSKRATTAVRSRGIALRLAQPVRSLREPAGAPSHVFGLGATFCHRHPRTLARACGVCAIVAAIRKAHRAMALGGAQ